MYGEHQLTTTDKAKGQGSSPHVRGAHADALDANASLGIIPACTGSTGRFNRGVNPSGDHPRMYGEHAKVPRVSRLQ